MRFLNVHRNKCLLEFKKISSVISCSRMILYRNFPKDKLSDLLRRSNFSQPLFSVLNVKRSRPALSIMATASIFNAVIKGKRKIIIDN